LAAKAELCPKREKWRPELTFMEDLSNTHTTARNTKQYNLLQYVETPDHT